MRGAIVPWALFACWIGWMVIENITGARRQERRRQHIEELHRAAKARKA